jgi:hypothetical protein
MARRIFLISPASCAGERARLLIRNEAAFPLAVRLRDVAGAELGEVFSFLSGLYFRGKLAYARSFARTAGSVPGILVITPTRGLLAAERRVTIARIREFASVAIDLGEKRYREPFERDARRLATRLSPRDEVVLLGSVATGKYVDLLLEVFGPRLLFPKDFAGRGDMSRGGLLLRSSREGRELVYAPVASGARHGPRPRKLAPLPRASYGKTRP